MKKIVRKAFFDFEKEEKFLNKMAAEGWVLTHVSWCKYVFEHVPNNQYIYRIELLEKPINHHESESYLQFMKEAGIEMVDTYNRWVYFRKNAADGEFDIYTDLDSKIKHYQRVLLFFIVGAAVNFILGMFNSHIGERGTTWIASINSYIAIISYAFTAFLVIFLILPLTTKIQGLKKQQQIKE